MIAWEVVGAFLAGVFGYLVPREIVRMRSVREAARKAYEAENEARLTQFWIDMIALSTGSALDPLPVLGPGADEGREQAKAVARAMAARYVRKADP